MAEKVQNIPDFISKHPLNGNKKVTVVDIVSNNGNRLGCGGRTRTYDLRVMSPTSFQLLYSAILHEDTARHSLEHILAQLMQLVNKNFSRIWQCCGIMRQAAA